MTIHSSIVNASQFYHAQAKTSPTPSNDEAKFSDILSASIDAEIDTKNPAKHLSTTPPQSMKGAKLSLSPNNDHPQNYQKIIDRMQHLANRSANYMTDEQRAAVSKEFEALSDKLYAAFERTNHFPEAIMGHLGQYIEDMDISNQMSAAQAYNRLSNMDDYIDSLDGIAETPNYESKLQTALDDLIGMANSSANHMTPAQRAELAQEFETKMAEYMDMIDKSDIFIPQVETLYRDYFDNLNIETPQQAAVTFNQLSNFMDHLSTYV